MACCVDRVNDGGSGRGALCCAPPLVPSSLGANADGVPRQRATVSFSIRPRDVRPRAVDGRNVSAVSEGEQACSVNPFSFGAAASDASRTQRFSLLPLFATKRTVNGGS